MTELTQYGVPRTACTCPLCIANCQHVSGMLVPRDLLRFEQAYLADSAKTLIGFQGWCLSHLAASPGAVVGHGGQVFRIPTIVPRRLEDGRCHWLNEGLRCRIHATAPYGCAVFDNHMDEEEGARLSNLGLVAIAYDWCTDGPYSQLWHRLVEAGRLVCAPEVARQAMAEVSA